MDDKDIATCRFINSIMQDWQKILSDRGDMRGVAVVEAIEQAVDTALDHFVEVKSHEQHRQTVA